MDEVKITRYAASMTGAKLRKQLGLVPKKRKPESPLTVWWLTGKLRSMNRARVPAQKRLEYLIEMAAKEPPPIFGLGSASKRRAFDAQKQKQLLLGCLCYVCREKKASVRHHVQPLSADGSNKRKNVVPLCDDCHAKIHPWLQKPRSSAFS